MARFLLILMLLGQGCAPPPSPLSPAHDVMASGALYIADPLARRAALEASFVNPDNGYAQLRLARYTDTEWGALPLWNPLARPIKVGESAPESLVDGRALAYRDVPWTRDDLVALGERAFFTYPVQIAPALGHTLADPAAFGVDVVDDVLTTTVWVETDGGVFPALTCASCHAARDMAGEWRAGKTNTRFDYGRILDAFYQTGDERSHWGPARVDVTGDAMDNPTVVTDLRPMAHQQYIHRAATLRNDPIALAIRLETLLITSSGQVIRPPREITFAMALYLWSLADALPPVPTESPGRVVFDRVCAGCHAGPGLAGPLVPLEIVGTDSAVGDSSMRGTGAYRTPSLRGVGDRTPLMAAGGVPDLEDLLDPQRKAVGHAYGFDLSADERRDLLAFLRAL